MDLAPKRHLRIRCTAAAVMRGIYAGTELLYWRRMKPGGREEGLAKYVGDWIGQVSSVDHRQAPSRSGPQAVDRTCHNFTRILTDTTAGAETAQDASCPSPLVVLGPRLYWCSVGQ